MSIFTCSVLGCDKEAKVGDKCLSHALEEEKKRRGLLPPEEKKECLLSL